MKVTFLQKDLAQACALLQNIVSSTTPIAVLKNLLLETNGDQVIFTASDYDTFARLSIPAKVATKGKLTLPAKTFADLVKELPNADVSLEAKGTKAQVKCEGLSFQLATMPADDFPEFPEFKASTTLVLPQAELRVALERVACAMPSRDPRRVLLGCLFDLRGEEIRLVATDGKKLIKNTLMVAGVDGPATSAIVPAKMVNELIRQLDEAGTVRIQFGERRILFDTGRVTSIASVIEGDYPPYDLVIPKAFDLKVRVPREPLMADLRRASIVQDKNEYAVMLRFQQNALTVSARGHELGTFEGSIPIEFKESKFEIVFNYVFLQDILKATGGGDTLLMKMNNPGTPAVLEREGDPQAIYLIMPIKQADMQPVAEDEAPDDDDEEPTEEESDRRF